MICRRLILRVAGLMAIGLVIVGCGSAPTPIGEELAADHQISPLSPISQLSPIVVDTEAPPPTSAPMPTSKPVQLTVLHTNDNWGETEPCG
jgi:hypothetical protein